MRSANYNVCAMLVDNGADVNATCGGNPRGATPLDANDDVFLAPSSLRYNFSQEDPLIQVGMRSLADAGIKPQPYHGPVLAGAATDANTPAFNNAHTHSVAIDTGVSFVHTPILISQATSKMAPIRIEITR